MTKAEVIAEIMYELKMSDKCEFEVDSNWYMVYKKNGTYFIKGVNSLGFCLSASDVRKAISKLGKTVIQL